MQHHNLVLQHPYETLVTLPLITSETLETYICNIGGGRGQGRLILASKWEPALSDNTRAPPARAALHGCPWLGGDQPEARDGTISASRGGRRCPYLISSALPDVIVERGCGAISVEGKRGGEPISRPSWPEVPSERDRSGWAGATN
jgi:hypothetical protein